MSTVARQLADLHRAGPVLECLVGPTRSRVAAAMANGSVIPSPVAIRAVVDTGASDSVLNSSLIHRLALEPRGRTWMRIPMGEQPIETRQYAVDLLLPSGEVLSEVAVLAADLEGHPVQALLGRDVLSRAVLVYVGELNAYSLSF